MLGVLCVAVLWKLRGESMDRLISEKEVPSAEPSGDLISRQAVDTLVDELARAISDERCCISRGRSTATIMQDILDLPSVKLQEPKIVPIAVIKFDDDKLHERVEEAVKNIEIEPKWIPMTARPMTEEEREHYREWSDVDEAMIFDCELPEDGQEVLVSYGGYVCVDTFCKDDGCYFEGVDIDDVDAWMPLPEPYKAESEDKECIENS